jgi:protein O-mannosyl-transferase
VTSSGSKRKKGHSSKEIEPRRGRGRFSSPLWRGFLFSLLLAGATLALYFPASHHPFVNYDDDEYVTDNVPIQSGLDWSVVGWAFTTYHAVNWHPLTWLSHALDVQLYGLNPVGHHVTNICLHALNVVLLFWVLLQATARTGRSLMVAALFAVHPINVESVVWIAERKNLLSMLFFLLALAAYRWYAREPRASRYVLVALLFALGLLAKPQVITLPFVLLLWDYWPQRRMFSETSSSAAGAPAAFRGTQFWRLIGEKAPLLILAGISAVLTMRAQSLGGLNFNLSLALRLENAIVAYVRYIGKALWPVSLLPIYPHPGTLLPLWQVLAAVLILAAITALVVARRSHRYLPVGWFWFLGTLVPMIGVVQAGRQALADRYAYLPFVGLFIMICWAVGDGAEGRNISPRWLAAPSVAVLIALAAVTYRQISYWNDNVVLWTYTFQVTKGDYGAEYGLAQALLAAGQPERAMPHFQAVTWLDPAFPPTFRRGRVAYAVRAHMYIGAYEQKQGRLTEALDHYNQVLSLGQSTGTLITLGPAFKARLFANMGHAYRDLGDLVKARDSLREAVRLDPDKFDPWMDLGFVEQKSGHPEEAAQAYSRALKLQSSDVGYLLLARALEQSGRQAESQAAIQRAKLVSRNFQAAQGVVDKMLGP